MTTFTPHLPSLKTPLWMARFGAEPGQPFKCPICQGDSALVNHAPPEWPIFTCPTCPTVPTIHDLIKVWPVAERDCDRSIEARAGTVLPGDPSFTPRVRVIPLGYDETATYYYQNSLTGHIVPLKSAQHKEDNLCGITPDYQYWFWAFGKDGDGNVDWKKAMRALIAECQIRGRFRIEDVRGGGVWMDNGRIVANFGTHLLVDGVKTQIQGFDSEYMYDAMIKAVKIPAPLEASRAALIPPILNRLPFSDGTGHIAVGGWVVVAMLSGILSWRPHLWLTGAAESGKSSILTYIISRLLKPMGAAITDESTSAAGIRQRALRHSAVPVVMDESESDDAYGLLRVKSIVKMARSASTDTEAVVYKGTQGGGGMEFSIRSCFTLCSIVESLTTPQDRQRFTVVQCARTPRSTQGWPDLKYDLENTITADMGLGLYAAVIRDARVIMENIRIASRTVYKIMGQDSRRHSDQLGSFIAGYFYLTNMGETISEQAATELYHSMNHLDIQSERKMEEDTPRRCLHQIYAYRPQGQQHTLGECVEIIMRNFSDGRAGFMDDHSKAARDSLRRMGLDVDRGDGGKHTMAVAVSHPELREMLEKKGFSAHNKLLRRLPGVTSGKTRKFAGIQSHSINVPLWVPEDEDEGVARGTVSMGEIQELFDAGAAEPPAEELEW